MLGSIDEILLMAYDAGVTPAGVFTGRHPVRSRSEGFDEPYASLSIKLQPIDFEEGLQQALAFIAEHRDKAILVETT